MPSCLCPNSAALLNIPAWLCCRTLSLTNLWYRDSKGIGANRNYCNILACQAQCMNCGCCFAQFPCCMPKSVRIWGETALIGYLDPDAAVINEILKTVSSHQQAYKTGKLGPAGASAH